MNISGQVEQTMLWVSGFFKFYYISQKYWQLSVNHSETMQSRSDMHEKLLYSTLSLFCPQKKTVKWAQHLVGSNTFWCWKAVLNHCKVGEVVKNRTRTVCSLLQQQPEQSVLTEGGKEEGAKTREEKVSARCSSERPPWRRSQSAGMAWGRKREWLWSLCSWHRHMPIGAVLIIFFTTLPVPWNVDFYRYLGSCRHH